MHTIYIYDDIGPDWLDMVSAKFITSEIAKAKPSEPITVRINSPGGDVFEGQAIYNALVRRGNITVEIDAIAASAASYIAMAGDKIRIAENAMIMIHNAHAMTMGDKQEHSKRMELLDKVDNVIIDMYAAKTGKTREDLQAAMNAETWYTAKEAVENGFANEIGTPLKMHANLKDGRYRNAPANMIISNEVLETERRRKNSYYSNLIRLTNARNSA